MPLDAPELRESNTFGADLAFLREHVEVLLLSTPDGQGQMILAPAYQGRVMTSTAGGEGSPGFGWINRALIASGERRAHINAYGGEDRFWLGPEGGQYSIFFAPGAPFELAHWQTPPIIDTDPFEVVAAGETEAAFRGRASLTNHSGTRFEIQLDRRARLLERGTAAAHLGTSLPDGIRFVSYESENTLTNAGASPWSRESGLLSIWMLGMFAPSPRTTVVVPYRDGSEAKRGPLVNDAYFGPVPGERLRVGPGVLFFRGDGQQRGKIGLGPRRARNVLGSYDAGSQALTLVQYNQPEVPRDYVNSMWEIQATPYSGDVVNAYNDGPPAPGQPPLGPFYELETSSPAAALAPGESLTHVHRTFHLQGAESALDPVARGTLGVDINAIRSAFEG